MSGASVSAAMHGRLFGALLRAYPSEFREAHGSEMTTYFLARLQRARTERGVPGVARLWLRTVRDIVTTAIAERHSVRTRATHGRKGDP
ncbi:MAG TPA: hypothetical protein VHG09_09955, partial [Longimicrobiales bacterium]|nr:hypothetical protein [Longimicrobiales bacterium]